MNLSPRRPIGVAWVAILVAAVPGLAKAQKSSGGDGVRWQSADGQWQAQPLGRLQFDYRTYRPGGQLPGNFSLRRIRLGASVTYARDYTFVLEGEYATGNAATGSQTASLVNGYLQLGWFQPNVRLVAGQFKPQFGLENTGSDNLTDFTERSLQFGLLQNFSYDRGVMVAGAPRPVPGLGYALAVTNGTGINTEEQAGNPQSVASGDKMVTLRLTENVAALAKRPGAVLHLGLDYKSGSAANSPSAPYTAPEVQTEGRGVAFFAPEPFNAASGVTAGNVSRTIRAYEAALAEGPLKLQGEYWRAKYAGTRNAPAPVTAYDLTLSGYYLSLVWMATGEKFADWYQGGQFGRIKPRRNFRDHGAGAWQFGVRYSVFDGTDFGLAGPANAGRLGTSPPTSIPTNEAKALTVGATWALNPYTRVLVNYVHTRFTTPVTVNARASDHEDALVVRGQIDF